MRFHISSWSDGAFIPPLSENKSTLTCIHAFTPHKHIGACASSRVFTFACRARLGRVRHTGICTHTLTCIAVSQSFSVSTTQSRSRSSHTWDVCIQVNICKKRLTQWLALRLPMFFSRNRFLRLELYWFGGCQITERYVFQWNHFSKHLFSYDFQWNNAFRTVIYNVFWKVIPK